MAYPGEGQRMASYGAREYDPEHVCGQWKEFNHVIYHIFILKNLIMNKILKTCNGTKFHRNLATLISTVTIILKLFFLLCRN